MNIFKDNDKNLFNFFPSEKIGRKAGNTGSFFATFAQNSNKYVNTPFPT